MRTQWAKVYFGCRRLQPFPTCLGRLVLVQSLSRVQFFVTPWTEARQAPLFFSISRSLPKFMSIESVILFNHLILCCSLLLLPSVFPHIRVFSSELALHIRWPKYWSLSFSISPSNEYSGLISLGIDYFALCCPMDSQEYSPASQFEKKYFSALSLLDGPTLTSIHD